MKRKIEHIDLNKHLTQHELLDYNKGVLGNEKMYRIELHLNECELCSDAIEGLDYVHKPTHIIDSINQKINPIRNEKYDLKKYLPIAASIILIAASSLTFWLISQSDTQENLALNSTSKEEEQKFDSATTYIEDSTNTTSAEREEIDKSIAPKPAPENKLAITESETISNPIDQKAKLEQKVVAINDFNIVGDDLISENEIAIVDEDMEEKSIELQSNQEGVLSAQPQPSMSNETSRAKKAVYKEAIILEDRNEPEPSIGMTGLKTYFEQNIIYPQQAIDNNTKGTVTLEVTIAANGTIKEITVVKGIGFGCDIEAKRLITEGPKWLPAVKDGVAIESNLSVKIKFKP